MSVLKARTARPQPAEFSRMSLAGWFFTFETTPLLILTVLAGTA